MQKRLVCLWDGGDEYESESEFVNAPVIGETAEWQPNTSLEKDREMYYRTDGESLMSENSSDFFTAHRIAETLINE